MSNTVGSKGRPHNPKVVGSNPAPATNTSADLVKRVSFVFSGIMQAQKRRKSFQRLPSMMLLRLPSYSKTLCIDAMAMRCWSMFTCV